MEIPFWQSPTFVIAALTVLVTAGLAVWQNRAADRRLREQGTRDDARRSAEIARDDRLRAEDRVKAENAAEVRDVRALRERLCDEITEYVNAASHLISRVRVGFLAGTRGRALDHDANVAEWESVHETYFNALAAAQRLDPGGSLKQAVLALRDVSSEYVGLPSRNPDAPDKARIKAASELSDKFVDTLANLGDLMDTHRLKLP